jgi:hypothetical protein
MTQLCNIEALEQIGQWDHALKPSSLIAYATAQTRVEGLVIDADGGAFRANGQWYGIKFHCAVGADFQSVTEFAFEVGEAIPKDEWNADNLADSDKDED